MKKRVIIAGAVVAAVLLIILAIVLIPKNNKSSDSTKDTVQPWSVAYFTEMRGLYEKIESDQLTENEKAYNQLIDDLNVVLNEYEKAAAKDLSTSDQAGYDGRVQEKIKEIEAARKKLESPQSDRESLLEKVYELDAEIVEANTEGESAELTALAKKTSALKAQITQSQITLDEADAMYQEYKNRFHELTSQQQ